MANIPLWKRSIYYLTMTAITCTTIVGLSELVLRLSGRVTVESVHTASQAEFDQILGAFAPDQNLTETPHPKLIHHVSINSLGYRGPEINKKKPPGTVRILCLGDSGTYGHYVNDDETFPFYLQQRFVGEHLPVEVINAGVPDTTIVDEWYYLKRSIAIEPDIVILTFSENDIDDLAKDTPTYLGLERNRKLKSSGIAGLFYRVVRDTALFNFGLRVKARLANVKLSRGRTKETEPGPNGTDEGESLWKQYADYLNQMKSYLEEQGVLFVFNAFPTHHRIGKDASVNGPMAEQLDRVEGLARSMGIRTISILQPFQSSMLTKNELYLLPNDGHASKKGYLIQAKTVFQFIRNDVVKILSTR
jgi:GDSL-like Lipase/Acylhydrolase family